MRYSIDFQQLHKGRERPTVDGDVVGVSFESESGFALIPNVGDVVHIPEMEGHSGGAGSSEVPAVQLHSFRGETLLRHKYRG
ncbi:hypothetical protein [Pseudomonas sp. Q11]|uniref:hypothetical protein n=1 Tax=Pseudomonas sp. Q11 TaxID=2968470 RepID=UPI00210BCF8E|nr:hypothetical protein [Pseudomonas sp. Q11]MCQ6259812.1 hypothetical protein [Pseudomonas sp. Q11]